MNVRSWLKKTKDIIPSLDAELILAHVLGVDRVFFVSHDLDELTSEQEFAADELVKKRANRMPLAYLTNYKEFYGRGFFVNENVLIPRPETETIIDLAKELSPKSILEIGTGSGCIAITTKLELPDTKVRAVDISEAALAVARHNAVRLEAKLDELKLSDLLSNISLDDTDLVIANLPYVDKNWDFLSPELAYEPEQALFANDNGLALIKKLILDLEAKDYHGYLMLESDPSEQPAVIDFAGQHGAKHQKTADFITLFKY
ncbi:peptide chain release factor N(5)-glutamine methyltransferase [Candidatus Saccharibacteria bacterium]|nr:peptide chain release factor N(5)-glutamine methyltransferase [Candidatus Saccharibacteria bacterium]MBR6964879.1 peptide chain release factor N(5)-glutamine methyltransferase [Candidatus Saccharibacteria bacterium]